MAWSKKIRVNFLRNSCSREGVWPGARKFELNLKKIHAPEQGYGLEQENRT